MTRRGSMSDLAPASPFLLGRDAELAQIESVVADVARRGGTVRIAGDPGVGKSALLLAGTELAIARGYTALSVRATEAEGHLAFAALYQLLRPVLGRIDELPAGHRAALMSAFGLAEPGVVSANRFFIALAALELLADAAADAPVLVGVDDLSWLDDASREAIEFISRRINDEQIVMLTTCRLNQPPESTFGSLLLWLEALDTETSRELLRHQAPHLSAADEARVLEAAAGNPLALLELAKVAGRAGESSFLASIPLPERLERSFAAGLDNLDPPVRTALLVAAVQDSDQIPETSAALARLTGDHDARGDAGRGAPGLAEEWLRRAAELSEDERHQGHRLLRAAELGFELGRHETVSELMSEARTLRLDPSDYARLAGLEGAFDDGIPGDEDNISRLVEAG